MLIDLPRPSLQRILLYAHWSPKAIITKDSTACSLISLGHHYKGFYCMLIDLMKAWSSSSGLGSYIKNELVHLIPKLLQHHFTDFVQFFLLTHLYERCCSTIILYFSALLLYFPSHLFVRKRILLFLYVCVSLPNMMIFTVVSSSHLHYFQCNVNNSCQCISNVKLFLGCACNLIT